MLNPKFLAEIIRQESEIVVKFRLTVVFHLLIYLISALHSCAARQSCCVNFLILIPQDHGSKWMAIIGVTVPNFQPQRNRTIPSTAIWQDIIPTRCQIKFVRSNHLLLLLYKFRSVKLRFSVVKDIWSYISWVRCSVSHWFWVIVLIKPGILPSPTVNCSSVHALQWWVTHLNWSY